jgi:hypothetical protein
MRYIDWILPLKIKNLIKHFFKIKDSILKEIETKEIVDPILETNQGLNNSVGDNKTCYILACGPSINEMDLSKLIGRDCISVSNFFVHPLYKKIQPKYHVFAPTHDPITEEQYNTWIADFQVRTPFEIMVFMSIVDKSMTDKVNKVSKIKRYYYELSNKMPDLFEKIELDKPMPSIQTVVHIAIYIAISLGYKEIRLLGVDHNWILSHGKSTHFYEENESELNNKGYVEYNNDMDWELQLQSNLNLWKVYKSINKFIKSDIKIINNTENSLLDVFPKELFK